jgi:hypothetical protein
MSLVPSFDPSAPSGIPGRTVDVALGCCALDRTPSSIPSLNTAQPFSSAVCGSPARRSILCQEPDGDIELWTIAVVPGPSHGCCAVEAASLEAARTHTFPSRYSSRATPTVLVTASPRMGEESKELCDSAVLPSHCYLALDGRQSPRDHGADIAVPSPSVPVFRASFSTHFIRPSGSSMIRSLHIQLCMPLKSIRLSATEAVRHHRGAWRSEESDLIPLFRDREGNSF